MLFPTVLTITCLFQHKYSYISSPSLSYFFKNKKSNSLGSEVTSLVNSPFFLKPISLNILETLLWKNLGFLPPSLIQLLLINGPLLILYLLLLLQYLSSCAFMTTFSFEIILYLFVFLFRWCLNLIDNIITWQLTINLFHSQFNQFVWYIWKNPNNLALIALIRGQLPLRNCP